MVVSSFMIAWSLSVDGPSSMSRMAVSPQHFLPLLVSPDSSSSSTVTSVTLLLYLSWVLITARSHWEPSFLSARIGRWYIYWRAVSLWLSGTVDNGKVNLGWRHSTVWYLLGWQGTWLTCNSTYSSPFSGFWRGKIVDFLGLVDHNCELLKVNTAIVLYLCYYFQNTGPLYHIYNSF